MTTRNNNFIEPENWTRETFPTANDAPEGMKTIEASQKSTYPTVKLHVKYAHKSNMDIYLQIITPALEENDKTTKFPLIMWVQGSAFQKQSVGYHMAHLIEVAKQGYVVAMVQYRWAPDNPFPAQVKDLHTATRFMLKHADQYHVDANNYIAWGDSSGGNTVTLGVLTEDQQGFNDEDVSAEPLHYNACVEFYGPTDISRMNKVPSTQNHVLPTSPEGKFMGEQNVYEIPDLVQKANPINYIDEKPLVPFLIMHGNKDRIVPFEQSVLLYEALKKYNHDVEFYRILNSDHSTDAFWTEDSLKVILDFIKKNIK